jgi:hypothetical protein
MADNLKRLASQVDNLLGLILIMMVLWLVSEFYNGFEYAKTNLALFMLGDRFTQEVKEFKSNIESTLVANSFSGTYEVLVQTYDGQIFYRSGRYIGDDIYPVAKFFIQADSAEYGYDVRIIKIDIYPEDDALKSKMESNAIAYLEPFSGIVQDVSRQITRRQEFTPPDISLFSISAPSNWFPLLIALFSVLCSQIINSFGMNLTEFIQERKKHNYKGNRRAFLDRVAILLAPTLFIQSYKNKKWYPFSHFAIIMVEVLYVFLIAAMTLKVNLYREHNNLPILMDLTPSYSFNALFIISSLLMIRRSLNKIMDVKMAIVSKEKKA